MTGAPDADRGRPVAERGLRRTGHAAEPHALRVLLAEDDPAEQKAALQMLDRLGLAPDVVSNGQDAVDAITALGAPAYDLVLLDVEMPLLDGLGAAREIRRHLGRDRPRLVAMTAPGSAEDLRRSLDAGMDNHLTKPLTVAALRSVLRATTRTIITVPPSRDASGPDETVVRVVDPAERFGAVFDPAVVDAFAAKLGGLHAVEALVAALDEEAPVLLMDLHRGMETRDPRLVQAAAHTLETLLATFGLMSLAAQAGELEVLAREDDLRAAELRVLVMLESFEAARERLRDHLGRPSP